MTSIINTQAAKVDQIVIPLGTGIEENSSPSLEPIVGSLAVDASSLGLFIGDGDYWQAAGQSTGLLNAESQHVATFSFTKSGQTSFSNCTLDLALITIGTVTLKILTLRVNQQFAVSAVGTWDSPVGIVPAAYRPNTPVTWWPISSVVDAGIVNTSWVEINGNTGTMTLNSPTTGTSLLGFSTMSAVYI